MGKQGWGIEKWEFNELISAEQVKEKTMVRLPGSGNQAVFKTYLNSVIKMYREICPVTWFLFPIIGLLYGPRYRESRWLGSCKVGVNNYKSSLNIATCLNQILSNCFCLQKLEVRHRILAQIIVTQCWLFTSTLLSFCMHSLEAS